jgi:hypothetical protein
MSPAGIPWPANNQLPANANVRTTGQSSSQIMNNPHYTPGSTATDPGVGEYDRVASDVQPQVGAQVAGVSSEVVDETSSSRGADDGAQTTNTNAANYWPEVPGGEPVRMTRSLHFELEYDIEAAVPAEVAEVQLWGTEDGGRTWEKWGKHADRQKPLEVQVDHEGIYGFRLVIVAANGLSGEIPQDGSPADLWIGVDATSPTVAILSVAYGAGSKSGQLDIRWNTNDQRLGARPITLSFSADAKGPWTTIASGLPNTGQYYWQIDVSVPKQVFLRVESRDEAGNSAECITREAVNTAGLTPSARIRSIRPVEE